MSNITDDKILNIYTTVHDTNLDINEKENICEQVQDFHEYVKEEMRNTIRNLTKKIHNMQNELDMTLSELDDKNKTIVYIPHIFEQVALIRQLLNVLFQKMWEKYKNKLDHVNFEELVNRTNIIKRKNIIDDNNGSKFALAIIWDVDKSIIFPQKLCEVYIKLNDRFHPKIKPIETSITVIKLLRETLQQSSSSLIQTFGITNEVLDNLEEQLTNNKSLFN
jgi:hypothetical protein